MYGTEVGRNRASSNVMHPTTTKSVRGEFDWSSVKVLMLDHDDNLCERGDNNNNNGNGRAIARGSQQQMDGTVDSQEERQDKRHRRTMSMLHEVEKTLRKLHDDKKQQQNMLEREMSAVKHEIILLRQSIDRMNKLMDDNDNNNNNVSNNKNANAFRNRNMSFGMYIDTVNMETAKILDKCKMIDSIECDRKRKIQIESMQKRKREKSDKRRQQASQQQHRYQQRQQQQQQQQRRPVYVNVQVKSENAEVRPVQFVDQTQGNDDAIAQNSPPSPPTMQRRRGVIMQEDISSIGDLDLDVRTENECQDHLHVDPNPCNRDNTNETEDDEERYTQFLNASFSFNGSSTESSDFLC